MATAVASVMFTDIRGFTARTSRDTRVMLEELLSTHENLLLPVIKHYDGRVVKTIGDAFLVVFESPTNAVLCGVVIQRRLHLFNESAAEEKKIEVRVAINSGEVTLRGDDVFGEPVNIAARIEGITEPNEIYFTEATYLTMQKAEVPSSEVGTRRLKGIPEEIKLYKVIQDESNELYKQIISHAEIAEDTAAAAAGSLSIPQWPPPRGKLESSTGGSGKGLLIAVVAAVVMVIAFFATQAWRESVRYDGAREALAAKNWTQAQQIAGDLWGQRGDDQVAIKILTEAIISEIEDLVTAGDIQALQDRWTVVKRGWGNLPAKQDIERRVNRAKLEMQIAHGDAPGAIEALHQLWEADKADVEVPKLIVSGLKRILLIDFDTVKNQKALDTWFERFNAYSKTYKDLPGFAAVRADACYGMGMMLTAHDNNFWKDGGIKLFRAFLQENPDDRDRGYQVRLRAVIVSRWSGDPAQLIPYLDEKPERAKLPEARQAVLGFLTSNYDFDDKEDIAARAMAWKYWGADITDDLHEWIATGNEKQRLNAFLILKEAGALRDEETDAVLSWILLNRSGSFHNEEFSMALDHWGGLVRSNLEEAKARARTAVPKPLLEVANLTRGASAVRGRATSAEEWLAIVEPCFYDQIKTVMLTAVINSRYAGERQTARKLLKMRGDLPPKMESESHLTSILQWNYKPPGYFSSDLQQAVSYFMTVDFANVHDKKATIDALTESAAIADDKIAAIEENAKLDRGAKRRRVTEWKAFQTAVKSAIVNVNQND